MIADLTNEKPRTYVGWTNDLDSRIAAHNTAKGAKATRGGIWTLVHSEAYKTRSAAMQAEYALKKNRILRKSLLTQYLTQTASTDQP